MGNIFSTCQDDTPGKPLDLSPPPPPEFAQKSLAQRSTASRALMSDLETNAANAQEAPNAAVPDAIAVDGTSPAWLSSVLGLEVESASAESMAAAGGLSGDMQRIRVTYAASPESSSHPSTYVMKQTKSSAAATAQSQQMGLVREALFYKFVVGEDSESAWRVLPLPRVHFASADVAAGTQVMLLEDLSSCVQLGLFFGPGSPLNWGKDLKALIAPLPDLSVAKATALGFSAAAKLHAPSWGTTLELVGVQGSWLRGAGWLKGQGEDAWRGYQAHAAGAWATAKAKMNEGSKEAKKEGGDESAAAAAAAVQWDPALVALVDAAVAKGSAAEAWDAFQAELKTRPLTLVHGDFHPANMMARPPSSSNPADEASIVLLDFEQVGVGSGPQDLGQFLISHASPTDRRTIESKAVSDYYSELCALNSSVAANGFSEEDCFKEYVAGGLGRWLWFVPVLNAMCPPKMTQYFCDQVLAFANDHGITPENVPMPRV